VLDLLSEMKKSEYEAYVRFHNEFGRVLKEGIPLDFGRREAIADLLIFPSTKTAADSFTTLDSYVANMSEGQEHIYYICGGSREEAMKSPHLEAFIEKGYEVLLMLDEIDDLVFGNFEYKGKKMKSVARGDIKLGKTEVEGDAEKYGRLVSFIREKLKEEVKDVRLSGRLKDSACCLVSDEGDIDPGLERIMKSMGQEMPSQKRILEINPDHPLFEAMNMVFEKDGPVEKLAEYAGLLYDQALLMEGSKPKDPASFSRIISRLMTETMKG
jgi:molecular chaperone HtpG